MVSAEAKQEDKARTAATALNFKNDPMSFS
jgi:hypothetical protein